MSAVTLMNQRLSLNKFYCFVLGDTIVDYFIIKQIDENIYIIPAISK